MSYRELRNFTEIMKTLGYQRLISVENFRTPNFELVADILFWLVRRYDPTAQLSDDISTEGARVEFLKSVASIMAGKARVKLNIKKLYESNGYAVKELLKVSTLLYDAVRARGDNDSSAEAAADISSTPAGLSAKLKELKDSRNMATEIIDSGGKLFHLLTKEEDLKVSRDRALKFVDSISIDLDSNDTHKQIERNIREQINIVTDHVVDLQRMCNDLDSDQKSLKSKIERKNTELERTEKRLASLRKMRPAFQEEYDTLEKELKIIYETYLEHFRNLQYLESELNRYHQADVAKKNESDRVLKNMQKKLRAEELRILRGEQEVDENGIDDGVFDSGKEDSDGGGEESGFGSGARGQSREAGSQRPTAAVGKRGQGGVAAKTPVAAPAQVVGSMTGGDSDDDQLSNFESDDDHHHQQRPQKGTPGATATRSGAVARGGAPSAPPAVADVDPDDEGEF